jgi:hypothetical protein
MDRISKASGQQDGHPSRREFLTRAGLMAGGMVALGISGFKPEAKGAITGRDFTGPTFLELDGQLIPLRQFEGGFPRAEVVIEGPGPEKVNKKRISQLKFQPIAIECDPIMPKPIFDWVAATLNLNFVAKDGALLTADANYVEKTRLQFNRAFISEIVFPACDGASKDAGHLTVKFAPESTTPLAGKGGKVPGMAMVKPQTWLPSNFRLNIDGVDCSRVSKIESFAIKQQVAQNAVGTMRDFKQPATLEFPNLTISIGEAFAGTFYAWFQDMVLKGNAGEQNERTGRLELLDRTLTKTLLTVNFHHLGIFGFTPVNEDPARDNIKRVKVEMYCEQITLTPGKVA